MLGGRKDSGCVCSMGLAPAPPLKMVAFAASASQLLFVTGLLYPVVSGAYSINDIKQLGVGCAGGAAGECMRHCRTARRP